MGGSAFHTWPTLLVGEPLSSSALPHASMGWFCSFSVSRGKVSEAGSQGSNSVQSGLNKPFAVNKCRSLCRMSTFRAFLLNLTFAVFCGKASVASEDRDSDSL